MNEVAENVVLADDEEDDGSPDEATHE